MIQVKKKEGESIERMLRRYKRKHKNAQISREIRKNQFYTKPSDKRRYAIEKAKYSNQMQQEAHG